MKKTIKIKYNSVMEFALFGKKDELFDLKTLVATRTIEVKDEKTNKQD